MDSLEGFVTDDELAFEHLREQGWVVTSVSWRRPDVDWSQFEAVVIRTTWDYHLDLRAFLSVLERIDASAAGGADRLGSEPGFHGRRWALRCIRLQNRIGIALPRVDLVRLPSDDYALMELELIEPSLYFRMDSEAAKRFALALDAYF